MNPTKTASAYRAIAWKLTDEAQYWNGESKSRLQGFARDCSRAATTGHFRPEVDRLTLEAANELWVKAMAIRGVGLLSQMLEQRS